MVEVKPGLRYSKTHEWARIEDGIATIGVSDYAQSELGDITYLELPEPGTELVKGEPMGVIESVKAASDLYAPVTGEVVEANQAVADSPEQVNSSPYDAWLVKVRLADPSQVNDLMDADQYQSFADEESAGH